MASPSDHASIPAARVGDLKAFDISIADTTPCRDVLLLLSANTSLPGVLIVGSEGVLTGLISRQRFMEVFSQPYRREVYFARPLENLIKDEFAKPLCVDAQDSISDAARIALSRHRDRFSEPIAVFHGHGNYRLLDTQDLLHALAQRYAFQYQELEATKDSLVQSEKLASLGGMVAGVAHEINTPIGVSLSAASFLEEKIAEFGKRVEAQQVRKSDLTALVDNCLEANGIIVRSMQRAAALIRSFKQVAADQTSERRRVFDLQESINEILYSLTPSFRQSPVRLTSSIPPKVEMDCFPGALGQIVSNLVLNAQVHAFPEGQAGHIQVIAQQPAGSDEVELVVKDNGRGIPADILGRIFDPFFTTRRDHGGTGLGLHIVHNLVLNTLFGTVQVTSVPAEGTQFVVRFPRITPNAPTQQGGEVRPLSL